MIGSLLVVSIAGSLSWSVYNLRRTASRQRYFERAQSELVTAKEDLATAQTRLTAASLQLRSLLEGSADGIAMLDSELRLAGWNQPFAAASWLPPEALRPGLPVDELLRRQAAAGAFGPLDNPEAEVAGRVIALRTQREQARLAQLGSDGQMVPLHVRSVADGGLILTLVGMPQ